jgi:membrane-bound metal-dependent hydrolase YbcI (DUF457 family)
MLGKTHALIGGGTGATLCLALHQPDLAVPFALAGAVGALLPDVDEPHALLPNAPWHLARTLGRPLKIASYVVPPLGLLYAGLLGLAWLATRITRLLSRLIGLAAGGHRGWTHHPLACGLGIAAGVYLAPRWHLAWWVAPALGLGLLTHLWADGVTVSGVPWFGRRRLHTVPRAARINMHEPAGQRRERLYRWGFVAVFAALWLTVLRDQAALAYRDTLTWLDLEALRHLWGVHSAVALIRHASPPATVTTAS